MIFKQKGFAEFSLPAVFLALMLVSCVRAFAVNQETISSRDLVIELGDGLATDAKLTFPAVGDGPFPGVLLIHGSGNTDMNEYTPSLVTGTGKPSRPFKQIAEYLSERGFAVLRYNKRGVGLNGTMTDLESFYKMTIQDLEQDAENALSTLMEQSEVDPDEITIIGHSEGAMIVPRIAAENPKIKNIVLLCAVAHNLRDVLEFQIVDRRVAYLEEVIDGDQDGLISINEVISYADSDILLPVPDFTLIENSTGEWLWPPGIDSDGDGFMSIHKEFETRMLSYLDLVANTEFPTSIWFRSHFELDPTLSMIGNVSCSILILQGEDDAQTPLQEALLLEQRLTARAHHDHTLKSYPGLGHSFYPVEGWRQPLGPIQDYVLLDLAVWLKDPDRVIHIHETQLQNATYTIKEVQDQFRELVSEIDCQKIEQENQIEELYLESSSLQNKVVELKTSNSELKNALDISRNIAYTALLVSIMVVLIEIIWHLRGFSRV